MNVSSTQNVAHAQLSTVATTTNESQTKSSSFQSVLESTIKMIELEEAKVTTLIGSSLSANENPDSSPTTFGGTSVYASLVGLLSSLSGDESAGVRSLSGSSANTAVVGSNPSQSKADTANAWSNDVQTASEKYNLPNGLLQAVIQQESGFNPSSVSNKGAMGLMQLMPDTAASLGVTNPLNPTQNIDGGAKYLRQLLDTYHNNIPLALAAYNAGPGAVDKYGGVPPYAETKTYVASILRHLQSTT